MPLRQKRQFPRVHALFPRQHGCLLGGSFTVKGMTGGGAAGAFYTTTVVLLERMKRQLEMLNFCPSCGILLQIEPASNGGSSRLRLFCPTCPYIYPITRKIVINTALVKKEVEPIFSGSDAMKFAPKTAATCPRCHHDEAYFKQVQIRSADEPMTMFYKCCKESCEYDWRED